MINQQIKSEGAIHDLTIEPRRVLEDNRGSVLHMTKSSELLRPIAEVYFSTINPGVTKGWKRHKQMWQRFSVPIGEIEFRFIDERPESPSR
jgi:dTDP-4-dehydrorhamnose 3,5-epimerase-like enzyme